VPLGIGGEVEELSAFLVFLGYGDEVERTQQVSSLQLEGGRFRFVCGWTGPF
jgi:hypothetical protein